MANDITLTGAQRSALLTLQDVASLSDRTQGRLTSGRRVNSVIDDAISFFQSRSLTDRASDFTGRRDAIDQGISSITAALDALEGIDSLLRQLIGVAEGARTQNNSERGSSTTQFNQLGQQISQLVEDASYQGLNLLNNSGSLLDVSFSNRTASRLQVAGFDFNQTAVSARGLFTATQSTVTAAFGSANSFIGLSALTGTATFDNFDDIGVNNSNLAAVSVIVGRLEAAVSRVRSVSAELGTNVAILQTRLDFTNQYANTLEIGSDKLTLADLNEEGANLVALQTRQQLGIQALSIAGQNQQSILALLQ